MDRLVALLNEYDSNWWFTDYWALFNSMNEWISGTEDLQVVSKKFWFIQWLVDNEKLKDNGIKPRTDLVKEIQIVDYETGKVLWWKNQYSETEQLIMYLSIQDNPIEFLVSILK